MTVKKILLYPENEAELRKVSSKVESFDAELVDLVRDMKDTLKHRSGAGLAAPQIGVHKHVVLVRFGQDQGKLRSTLVLVNPTIISASNFIEGYDGCLSFLDLCTWSTLRPDIVTFSAFDEKGVPFRMTVKGIDARLVHHEIDHLYGVLFIDLVRRKSDLYRIIETPHGERAVSLDMLESMSSLSLSPGDDY